MTTDFGMPLMGFGTSGIRDYNTMLKSVRAALTCGYRAFDTAAFYENQTHLGQALEVALPEFGLQRADIWLATKIPDLGQSEPVKVSLAECVAQLRCDYVDLLLVHYPRHIGSRDNSDPRNGQERKEAWLGFEELKASGLTKHIGVSNYEVRHLEEMKAYASIKPEVNQIEYHPHLTRTDLIAYCEKEHIRVTAHCSMGRQNPDLIGEPLLHSIAQQHGCEPTQVLLAFGLACGLSIIPKSTDEGRIQANWDAQEVHLTESEVAQLKMLDRHQNYTKCTPWLVE